MSLNVNFKCFEGSMVTIKSFFNFRRSASFSSIDKLTLVKLPDDIDKSKIFNSKGSLKIVFNLQKEVISLDYDCKYSSLLGINLDSIKNMSIDSIKKINGVNVAVIDIIEDMVNCSLKNKEFNGIIFDKNKGQYIVSTYLVGDGEINYGVYLTKSEYNNGFFSSNIFG